LVTRLIDALNERGQADRGWRQIAIGLGLYNPNGYNRDRFKEPALPAPHGVELWANVVQATINRRNREEELQRNAEAARRRQELERQRAANPITNAVPPGISGHPF
jgi:hypothetical protein